MNRPDGDAIYLDLVALNGVAASTGSAYHSGRVELSPVPGDAVRTAAPRSATGNSNYPSRRRDIRTTSSPWFVSNPTRFQPRPA
jgi:hypothetical protein